jgi:hypothetical protein
MGTIPRLPILDTPDDTFIRWKRELENIFEFLDNNGGYLTVLNSDQLSWDRNLVANSEFTAIDPSDTTGSAATGFVPRFWTISGTAISVGDNPWLGARTLKISTSSNVTYNPDDIPYATMNPQYSIEKGNSQMRFTAHIKGGSFDVRIYDQTYSQWFALKDTELQKSGTTLSYSSSSAFPRQVSISFNAAEFGENCVDVRIYISNSDASDYVYVNAPQISHDADNAEPQEYRKGRYCLATANNIPAELINLVSYHYENESEVEITHADTYLLNDESAFKLETVSDVSGLARIFGLPSFVMTWVAAVALTNMDTSEELFISIKSQSILSMTAPPELGANGMADIMIPFIVHQCPAGTYKLVCVASITEDHSEDITVSAGRFSIDVSSCSAEIGGA